MIEELWHLELTGRIPGPDGLTRAAARTDASRAPVTDEILAAALDDRALRPPLGANDRIHISTCRANAISVIVTADRAFEPVAGLRRVDPSDLEDVRRMRAESA